MRSFPRVVSSRCCGVVLLAGNALDDLTLEDFDLSSIDKELERDNDTNSVSSSISAGFSASGEWPLQGNGI